MTKIFYYSPAVAAVIGRFFQNAVFATMLRLASRVGWYSRNSFAPPIDVGGCEGKI
jgi:hypothetical protein